MKTDAQLQQDVMAELYWDASINAAHIGVEVNEGVVTLAGQVGSYAEKRSAEEAALQVAGVKSLVVEMDVELGGMHVRSDADIAHSASTILQWTHFLPANSVKIRVEDGWITLSGMVDWNYQRQAAAAALRFLTGVTGLTNRITLQPSKGKALLSEVRGDIEKALSRLVLAVPSQIQVTLQGSDLVLSGKAQSWSEREAANKSAWNTPGVLNVVDKMVTA
jgi:osmotically-inducible protein OsmY